MNMRLVIAWVAALVASGLGASSFLTILVPTATVDVNVGVNWQLVPTDISPTFVGVSLSAGSAGNGIVSPTTGFSTGAVASTSLLHAKVIRFPDDNSQFYHWQTATARGQLTTDDFWFLANQSSIGELMVTVNMFTGETNEASQWVEYANGAVTTPRGAERAAKGNPAFNIGYWMLGEDMVTHKDRYSSAGAYVAAALQNASAMRNVSSSIKIGLWIDEGGTPEGDAWNNDTVTALRISDPGQVNPLARRSIDFLAVRVKVAVPNRPLTDATLFPTLYAYAVQRTEEIILKAEQLSQRLPSLLPIAVYNLGIDFGSEGWNQDKADSLGAAIAVSGMMNALARHETVFTAIYYGLNTRGFNAVLKVPDPRLYVVPASERFGLNPMGEILATYGLYLDGKALTTTFDGSGGAYYRAPGVGSLNANATVPILSVAASVDEAERQLVLYVASRSLTDKVVVHLTVKTAPSRTLEPRVIAQVVSGESVSVDRYTGVTHVTTSGPEVPTEMGQPEPETFTFTLTIQPNSVDTFVFSLV